MMPRGWMTALGACLMVSVASEAQGGDPDPTRLTVQQASSFARLALKGINQEYPNKLDHVLTAGADVQGPRALHPSFFGSYDWHSSVHGHWMLVRLLRRFPNLPEAAEIRAVFADHFSASSLQAEANYFRRPASRTFERTYGWAWLLKLAEELRAWDDPEAQAWATHIRPLADIIAERYVTFLPQQLYPIRTGVHPNTAFGLALAHDYARAVGDDRLRRAVEDRARAYFLADADAPARWEPGGADFFSPSLLEADLMRRVLPRDEFAAWFARFLPEASQSRPIALFTPAEVVDRTDPQLVHLDGLNLNRAWTMRSIAAHLPPNDPSRAALEAGSLAHARAGLAHVASGDYAGEHWLASFAVYLLTEAPSPPTPNPPARER